jgi:hypothetical protein
MVGGAHALEPLRAEVVEKLVRVTTGEGLHAARVLSLAAGAMRVRTVTQCGCG